MNRKHVISMTRLVLAAILSVTMLFSCGLFSNNEIEFFEVTPISAVEVALEIHANSGDEVSIERDGNEIFSFRMSRKDTVIYDSDLSPNTSYIWKAINKSSRRGKSKERQTTTLTTTSSEFTWQKFEFGQTSNSFIHDVAIIDENNIWAVGEFNLNDSLGNPEVTPYNVAHWDGDNWEVIRLKFNCRLYYPNCGPVTELFEVASSVIAFDSTDVWISAGTIHHFDGNEWTQFAGIQGVGYANEIWGSNSKNLWFVGNEGFLVHYNGEIWQKLETGISLRINDIWGSKNPNTRKWEILAVSSEPFSTSEEHLLSISANTVQRLEPNEPDLLMSSVWFEAGRSYFIGGNDLFRAYSKEADWNKVEEFHPGFLGDKAAVRGNGLNDLFVVGTYGLVMHFNGAEWQLYEDQQLLPAGSYTSLDIKGDIVVAGGVNEGKGIILVGKRTQ